MLKKLDTKSLTKIILLVVVIIFLGAMCQYYNCGFYPALEGSVTKYLPKVILILFVLILAKLISSLLKILAKRSEKQKDFRLASMFNFIRYGLWIVSIFVVASILFKDLGALLTSVGLIGFGITFALQKPILNFVGWLDIKFHRSFEVGDRIKVGEYRGDVVETKMMNTTINSLLPGLDQHSGKMVSIPNELMLVKPVENYTKENNFLKTELKISITYESDWRRGKNALKEIVENVTKKHVHKFKNSLSKRISFIDQTIEKLSKRFKRTRRKKRGERLKKHMDKLEKKKETIKEKVEEMPNWTRPQIHVDMSDSSIDLVALYAVPYDMQRSVRTEIISQFLDYTQKEEKIEIAYPHLQLVGGKKSFGSKKISDFFESLDK